MLNKVILFANAIIIRAMKNLGPEGCRSMIRPWKGTVILTHSLAEHLVYSSAICFKFGIYLRDRRQIAVVSFPFNAMIFDFTCCLRRMQEVHWNPRDFKDCKRFLIGSSTLPEQFLPLLSTSVHGSYSGRCGSCEDLLSSPEEVQPTSSAGICDPMPQAST